MLLRKAGTTLLSLTCGQVRPIGGIVAIACMLACSAMAAVPYSARPSLERDCVLASVRFRFAACVVSDLDGDRQADYAILSGSARSTRLAAISIHLSSVPEPVELILPDGVAVSSFALRDINGDGWPDIALLGGHNQTVGAFLNDGAGRFQFDAQQRFVTAPTSDCSELSPLRRACACDCAEIGSGPYCAVCPQAALAHATPAASIPCTPESAARMRISRGIPRSRAP